MPRVPRGPDCGFWVGRRSDGVGSGENEAFCRAFCPEDFQCLLKVLRLPDQGPVVQEPQVAGEGGDSLGDEGDQGLEDEGEEQGGQGVPLVEA